MLSILAGKGAAAIKDPKSGLLAMRPLPSLHQLPIYNNPFGHPICQTRPLALAPRAGFFSDMEVFTPKSTRRSTRLRVEIPVILTSMDRRHPVSAECTALVVSPQGCGLRATQGLPLETPVLLGELPGGAGASGHVVSCLPLGADGKYFLIGISLYNPGNVWGVTNPPADWDCLPAKANAAAAAGDAPAASNNKGEWPYNLFAGHSETRSGRK
jgi:hypothetical protein